MYFQNVLPLRKLQGIIHILYLKKERKNLRLLLLFIFMLFYNAQKHVTREGYLESFQRYMMALFCEKIEWLLLAFNYFYTLDIVIQMTLDPTS